MDTYKFDIPRHHKSIIKVIGVGGGGSNAVNHMYSQGIKDVEFVVCNTDHQVLKMSSVPNRLQIGVNLTEGLGAGANPEVGRNAALENKEEIREMLGSETKMCFVTAGMGGGTGTGAAPVIAKIAREMEILTVGIITAPFSFEGKKKMAQAQAGIDELRENCDTVLVILNDKLREIYGNLTINNAFAQADNVLTTAAKGIAEIITVAGYVNVDFQDVRTVMKNAGAAVMGSAETAGENRATRAAEEALASPLLDNKDIRGAKNILLSIISGEQAELQMDELTEITEYIQAQAGDQAEVIFGHGVDSELEDRIRVTVIATGFDTNYRKAEIAEPVQQETRIEETEELEDRTIRFELDKHEYQKDLEFDNSVNHTEEIEKKEELDYSQFELKDESGGEKEEEKEEEMKDAMEDEMVTLSANISQDEEELEEFKPLIKAPSPEDTETMFDNREDDFIFINEEEERSDDVIDEDGLIDYPGTKERLERQALERMEKLMNNGRSEMDTRDFKEKLDVPAFLRKSVKLDNVPHSSEQNISKYKLNDDNQILGNNKFLHDNVD